MRENPEMNDFLKNHTIIKSDPLDRAMRFSVVAQETSLPDMKLQVQRKYAMYSLYVLKTSVFPYDHSDIYIGEECSELIGKAPNINFDFVETLSCTV